MTNTTKSDEDAIAELLRATPSGMSATELAKAVGIDVRRVHVAVRNLIVLRLVVGARDTRAPAQNRRSRYLHAMHFRATSKAVHWRDAPIYKGEDWASACARPGCLDHERHGSRRGDEVLPFHARSSFFPATDQDHSGGA